MQRICFKKSDDLFIFQFITSDVYGLFCWSFCDFGDSFEVIDPNGEEPKETFIAKITKVKIVISKRFHINQGHLE